MHFISALVVDLSGTAPESRNVFDVRRFTCVSCEQFISIRCSCQGAFCVSMPFVEFYRIHGICVFRLYGKSYFRRSLRVLYGMWSPHYAGYAAICCL